MKLIILLVLVLCGANRSFAQKPTSESLITKKFSEWQPKDWEPFRYDPNHPNNKAFPPDQYRRHNRKIEYITFHYVGGDFGKKEPIAPKYEGENGEGKALQNAIANLQIFQSKFGHIAYHFLIGNSGNIYEGRDMSHAPASGTFYFPTSYYRSREDFRSYLKSNGALDTKKVLADKPENRTDYDQRESRGRELWNSEKIRNPAGFPTNRDLEALGGLAPGDTRGHLTICFLASDYFKADDKAFKMAAKLAAILLIENGLSPEKSIRIHREVSTDTTCPGDQVRRWLRDGDGLIQVQTQYDHLKKYGKFAPEL